VAQSIDIVIRGEDCFTPAFERLDAAFGRLEGRGRAAGRQLEGLGEGFAAMGAQADQGAQAAGRFGARVTAEAGAALETQRQILAEGAALREEDAALLAAQLEARQAVTESAQARERESVRTHQEALAADRNAYQAGLSKTDADGIRERINLAIGEYNTYRELAQAAAAFDKSQGSRNFRFFQSLAVVEAIVAAYAAFNKALASGLGPPFTYVLAAAALARGLANVAVIRQQKPPAAHGGLDFVPREQTFLLERGERVLSPNQNRRLTEFLAREPAAPAAGSVTIGQLTIHVLENATSAEALLRMGSEEVRRVVADKLIPALDDLARLGIRPRFVESNI